MSDGYREETQCGYDSEDDEKPPASRTGAFASGEDPDELVMREIESW